MVYINHITRIYCCIIYIYIYIYIYIFNHFDTGQDATGVILTQTTSSWNSKFFFPRRSLDILYFAQVTHRDVKSWSICFVYHSSFYAIHEGWRNSSAVHRSFNFSRNEWLFPLHLDGWLCAMNAISSTNLSSRSRTFLAFLSDLNWQALKRFDLSQLNPYSFSRISESIRKDHRKKIGNSVGTRTQLCFAPFPNSNGSVNSFKLTDAIISVYKTDTSLKNLDYD